MACFVLAADKLRDILHAVSCLMNIQEALLESKWCTVMAEKNSVLRHQLGAHIS